MKKFFNKIITLILFLISAIIAYFSIIITFNYSIINICLMIIAIFFLIQACGNIDKTYKLGIHNKNKIK